MQLHEDPRLDCSSPGGGRSLVQGRGLLPLGCKPLEGNDGKVPVEKLLFDRVLTREFYQNTVWGQEKNIPEVWNPVFCRVFLNFLTLPAVRSYPGPSLRPGTHTHTAETKLPRTPTPAPNSAFTSCLPCLGAVTPSCSILLYQARLKKKSTWVYAGF